MNPQLLIAAIIAAIGFGAGWHLQTLRYTAKEADHAKQELAQIQLSAAASIRRSDNVIEAQNQSAVRSTALRRDLDGAHSELDRLRAQLAQPMPRAEAATSTCPDRADPARELLATCATELVEMGGIADRHASDVKTLTDAWPK